MALKIDAHHHLWQFNDRDYGWMSPEMTVLRRDFLVPELQAVLQASGIGGTVAVQARQTVEETRWLLGLRREAAMIRGVVGWVPLADPDLRRYLDEFAGDPGLKGVRHVLHDEPDDLFMLREDFNRGISLLREYALVYDLLVFDRHLPQTIELVDRHPSQVFVLDHIAKPRIRERSFSPWREQMLELAKRENVCCKLSGMATEADWGGWTYGDLEPYFDVVLEAFGPRRLMFGSDWPVLLLAAPYQAWVGAVSRELETLSAEEQDRIWRGTASAAYRL
ncbi:MAG: amidohydrolase family protein [Bryobacteraceae bacterium]|jgi:L-fuconolactonase